MLSDEELLANQIRRTGFEYLITDLNLALTMIRIASDANGDSEKRLRNRSNARRAFDSVSDFSRRLVLTDTEKSEILRKLGEVKVALERLGETF